MSKVMPAAPLRRGVSRRAFLTRAGMAAVGALLLPSFEAVAKSFSRERALSFHNVNTDEELTIVCCPERQYEPAVLQQFNHFLRDHRADEVRPMDPALIDLLFAVSVFTGSTGTFKVLSGYRSPETNSWLRKFNHGVAEHSMHIEGKAVDIRMTDVDTRTIHKVALALQQGGVGYYPRSDFVHLDTGAVRSW
ncbi:YcbK family protein [Candidatus Methylocalor cossyra]|uniref:Murein endopeptidase K n=1 Tax=Candidatus Methylocalor cossyra TaxID=3108543 RepID=A0ABP1CBS9_9GAMM